MRYLLAMILVGSIGVGVSAATDGPLDKQASDAIDQISAVIARDNNLSADKETDFYIGLSKAARKDRKMEDALIFGRCGNRVLKASKDRRNVIDSLLSPGTGHLFNDLQTMARKYQGDGVLSAVNYKALTTPDGPKKLAEADAWVPAEHHTKVADVLTDYHEARQNGFTPQEAFARIQTSNDPTSNPSAGLALMEKGLHRVGKLTLTGYDAASAHSDIAAYLEAKYARFNPYAPDIEAVTPAYDASEFIGNKVDQAIRGDLRTMLRPVNSYIEKFLQPTDSTHTPANPQPPVDNTPSFDNLNRTPAAEGGSGMPTWDEMKKPPGLSPHDPGWALQTWWALQRYPSKEIDLKCERIAYGVDVFKMRQVYSDRDLRIIGASTYTSVVDGKGDLQPNKKYVAIFNVWYWSDNGTTAYFADGNNGGVEPPSNMRAVVPPSDRKVVPVKVYFKTDATGKGCIALYVRGRCAVELEEFYHVRVADTKPTAGARKN